MARNSNYQNDPQDVRSKDDYLSKCRGRIDDAVKWRKNANYDEKWAKYLKLYANQYDYPELSAYTDVVAPNMVFSTVNVMVPSIVVNYPKISVTARNQEDEQGAATVEAFANYTWQHHDVHKEVKAAVKDFIIFGHGLGKVTWVLTEEEVDIERDVWRDQVTMALQAAEAERQKAASDPRMAGVVFPTDDEIIESIPDKETVVKEDHPVVDRISPFDFYIDPDATRFKDATWVAQKRYVPIEEARDNQDWNAKARKQLKAAAMSEAKSDQDTMFEGESRGGEANFAVVWEYYDLVTGQVCTFGEGAQDYLVNPAPVEYPFPHPYVMVENYSVPEKLYPVGDVEAIFPLQLELALTRTQMINDRKRFRRMYMYKPDLLGPDGIASLFSSDDNAMIAVDGDTPFAEIIAPIQTSSLPPEFYNQTAMILDDMNLVSGVTEYQRGSVAEVRRTATEAAMIQDMSNARSADKLAIVEMFIGELAQKTVQLAQQFLTTEQVARVVGPDGAAQWVPYSQSDIQGEFDFTVEAGSTQPQNETFRRQSAMQLLDTMAPFLSLGVVDPAKLAEHVLRNGFGIKDPSLFIMPPPIDPTTGMPMPYGMAPPTPSEPTQGEPTAPARV